MPYSTSDAQKQISDYTLGKYGRAPTDDEWGVIGQGIDYSSGQISDAQLQQAYGNADQYAANYGKTSGPGDDPYPAATNTTPTAPANTTPNTTATAQTTPTAGTAATNPYAGVNPTSSLTGTQALSQLQTAIGRPLTAAELQQARTLIGYTDPTGNAPMTGAQYNQLLQTAASLTPGANYSPYGGATTTPPPTTPATTTPAGVRLPEYGVNVPSNLQGTIGNLFQQQPATPIQSQYQTSLLDLINKSQAPVSLDDPNLARQSEQYRASRQRGTERQRSALAERAAQTGTLGAGGFDTAVGNLYGEESRDIAGRDTDIIAKEMDARRQQLTQALQLAQATGNAEAARLLQTQLGLLDASIQQTAIEQQGRLGTGDLIARLLQSLMQNQLGYDTLGSNNAYNYAALGQNYLQNYLNG
jgi:hypothetical protein